MERAGVILFAVVTGAAIIGWVLTKRGSSWGQRGSIFTGIAARLVMGVAFAYGAVRAEAHRGVFFQMLAASLAVLALTTIALAGFLLWGVMKYGVDQVAE